MNGKKTSVSLEDEFWDGFLAIAASRKTTPTALLRTVQFDRSRSNLSSAIRVYVLGHYRNRSGEGSVEHLRPQIQDRQYPLHTVVKAAVNA
jgi:predicted DNA-binding ribbon-helix-helix protein